MIIWGFRVIMRTLSTGVFLCPNEGGDRTYRLRSAQRFFTLFFIPLIPLKKIGNVVECSSCSAQFDEVVLQRPTLHTRGLTVAEVARCAQVTILRAGPTPPSQKAIECALRHINGYYPTYDVAALQHDFAQLDVTALPSMLSEAGRFSDTEDNELLLTHLILTALNDKGHLLESESSTLSSVGSSLGLTPAHTRGIIDSVVEAAARRSLS
jgi:hypothetical protein